MKPKGKQMKKGIITLTAMLLLTMSCMGITAFADGNVCKIVETGTEYATVQAAITAAGSGQTVQMIADSNETVTVESDDRLTLDLNGHVLNGGGNGSVITNNGTLTITDSGQTTVHNFKVGDDTWAQTSEEATVNFEDLTARPATDTVVALKGGCVTGGSGTGSAVYNYANSTMVMEGGNIVGNGGWNATGSVFNYATMTMSGGNIVGNYASTGGGVYNDTDATMTMTGGSIFGNKAKGNGGGVYNKSATMIMTGGTISGNIVGAKDDGGGVFAYQFTAMTVGGTAVITGNTAGANASNVGLYDQNAIARLTISGDVPLEGNACIGVTTYNTTEFCTNGTKADEKYFTSDVDTYAVKYDSSLSSLVLTTGIHSITNEAPETAKNENNGYISVPSKGADGADIRVTAVPNEGYGLQRLYYVAESSSEEIPITGGVFTMPESKVTVYAVFAQAYDITNSKPESDKAANHGYIEVAASAAQGAEVSVTAIPNEGCKVDSLTATYDDGNGTQNLTITDGKFTMPAYEVTVNATFSEIQTSKEAGDNFDLDLEDSTTGIPASTTVDQYYIKTTGSETVTNNRITITWTAPVATIRVSEEKKWNPATLSWVTGDNNGDATVKENTNVTVFTLKNYSINSFTCTMSFTPLTDYTDYFGATAASFDANNGTAIAAIETGTDGNALPKYYVDDDPTKAVDGNELPTLTITGTLNINASKFDNQNATSADVQYGNYTITCTKAN